MPVLPGTRESATPLARSAARAGAAFLRVAARWRAQLGSELERGNPNLAPHEINRAALQILVRLLFLRLREARCAPEMARPLQALRGRRDIHAHLQRLFHDSAPAYPALADEPLQTLIDELYAPRVPYSFAALPATILGQVYEQCLSAEERESGRRSPSGESRPAAKKATGIYYTPAHIVDYIIEHTIGALLQGKTPQQAARIKVLDPACGAGSFLVSAYRYLLAWYRERYIAAGPEGQCDIVRQGADGAWHLTCAARRRILLQHIYGVDIDDLAVEVTRLSLLLQLLEETDASGARLPDLRRQIKCGDALIGQDFAHPQLTAEQAPVRAFDWQSEFPQIMRVGGFDVIIGNPPYIFGELHNKQLKSYLESAFHLASRQYDTYWLFLEQGLKLTRQGGRFAFIVPDAILARDEARQARALLLQNGLERVYHCGEVFPGVHVSAAVLIIAPGESPPQIASDLRDGAAVRSEHSCARERFLRDPACRLLVHTSDREAALLARIQDNCQPLRGLVKIARGEEIGKRRVLPSGPIALLAGEDLAPYTIARPTHFVTRLAKDTARYRAPKIVVVKTGCRCIAALDTAGLATLQSVYSLHLLTPTISYEALLALLNSRFVHYFIYKTFTAYKLLFPQLNQTTLNAIPIPRDLPERQEPLAELARQLITLHTDFAAASTVRKRAALRGQIEEAERQVDALVYALYNLTPAETQLLENSV